MFIAGRPNPVGQFPYSLQIPFFLILNKMFKQRVQVLQQVKGRMRN